MEKLEAPASDDPETDIDGEEESEEDAGSNLDIHLRESLRILSDWIHAEDPDVKDTATTQDIADIKTKG